MAEGLIAALASQLLSGTADVHDYSWFKLHIAAPGSAGTANPATETTRKQVTWGTPSAGSGVMTMSSVTTDLVWTSIAGSEDATHFSMLDASTAGNVGFTGTIVANPYNAGDILTIPAGSCSASFPTAT